MPEEIDMKRDWCNQSCKSGVYKPAGVCPMKKAGKAALMTAAFAFAVIPLLSQTSPTPKPSFDVISIKPSAPNLNGIRGGGARGDRYTMSGATLRLLLQNAYTRTSTMGPIAQLQIIGGPTWIDADRYDIQATADCSGGALSREQVQLMVQSLLEDRFQLKAHMETRELPIYNLVVAKDGPKLKASADQTPPGNGQGPPQPCSPVPAGALAPPPPPPPPLPGPGQRGGPLDPNFVMPRGSMFMMGSPTGTTLRAAGVPLTNLVLMLQQQIGRPIVDKTDLKGLFDFTLQFGREGLASPGFGGGPPPEAGLGLAGPGAAPSAAADPVPSLFTAIQELGLRLESAKGPIEVLVVDSVQKPTAN
jgi:uncharacterized protein (TIGR03435 family)